MSKKIKNAMIGLSEAALREHEQLMARFDDPVARLTQWTPAARGGENFCNRRLVEVTPRRMEFRPTPEMLYSTGLIFILAVGVFIFALYNLTVGPEAVASACVLAPLGLLFGIASAAICYWVSRPHVFDMDSMWYWKGRQPRDRADVERRKHAAPLDHVHAIQIIEEWCHSVGKKRGAHYSYEINLVMLDGTRINVVDHGKVSAIRADAERLGRFIGVPVWDATMAQSAE